MEDSLYQIVLQDPAHVVDSLQGSNTRVTLTLYSGQLVSGLIVKTANQRGVRSALIQCYENPDDVIFARLDQVVAVRVHGYQNAAPVLTGGTIARSPKEQAPTKLELKRQLQKLSEDIQKSFETHLNLDVGWEKLPADEHAVNLNLRDLMNGLELAMRAVAADEIGKNALRELRVVRLIHTDDEIASVVRDGSVIELIYNFARALPSRLEHDLTDKISSVL